MGAREYDGKHWKNVEYTNDADGNRTMQEEVKPDGTRKVEYAYEYTVENRLKAVSDKNDLLTAMAYDGDGNRIFQLNYNLHTDDDWKGNSGNGNGNNKDNTGNGSKTAAAGTTEADEPGFWGSIASFFTGADDSENQTVEGTNTVQTYSSNKNMDKGNNGNTTNNGKGNGNGNKPNDNTSTGGTNDNNGNANGNTNNTGGSQNQSGILFPIEGEVSELEQELIDEIKTTGKQKNYELVEYVNDVNRDYAEVLMELNINGIMDTAYSYGDQRLTNERFTGWTGYYTYDPRGSVSGVTDDEGMIWQSYRYDVSGEMTFGKPQYNNVYSYNAESYNPNMDTQYLRARYYSVGTGNFMTEDSYLGKIIDPLTLNRYNYVSSNPLNYEDPSGYWLETVLDVGSAIDSAISFIASPGWVNAGFLLWDLGSVIVPLAPGSYVAKGAKYLGKVDDITDAVRKLEKSGDTSSDTYKLMKKMLDAGEGTEDYLKYQNELADLLKKTEKCYVDEELELAMSGIEKVGKKNMLRKGVRYVSNGYEYSTDLLRRITSVKGELRLSKAARDKYAQRILGGKGFGDDAGHLIASIFGGSGGIDNLSPMVRNLNRGEWRRMENQWARALLDNKSVEVIIEPVYSYFDKRPIAFQVGYSINNKIAEIIRFTN